MATHSIGRGKALVCVPMDKELARELGKRSYQEEKYNSKAAIARKLVELYLAGKIALPLVAIALFSFSGGIVISNSIANPVVDDDIVRNVRGRRRRRDDEVYILDEEECA